MIKDYSKFLKVMIHMHERNFLKRIVPYYQIFYEKYKIKVVIADSSEKSNYDFDFGNIEYVYYGPKKNLFKFRNEIYKNKSLYSLMIGDDDFVIPKSCIQCLEFLINNSNYTVCHGRYLRFLDNKNASIHNISYNIDYFDAFLNKEFESDRLIRIENLFKNFGMLNHAIIKTESLKKTKIRDFYKDLLHYRYSDQVSAHFYLMDGDHKVLDNIFMLRSDDRMLTSKKYKRHILIPADKNFSNYIDDAMRYKNPILQYMVKHYCYKIDKLSFWHGAVMGQYINKVFYKKEINCNNFIRKLINRIYNLLDRILLKLISIYKIKKYNESYEVKRILNIVKSFHKK